LEGSGLRGDRTCACLQIHSYTSVVYYSVAQELF
jgi:hypothetical protein